jgi:hypothetical protein
MSVYIVSILCVHMCVNIVSTLWVSVCESRSSHTHTHTHTDIVEQCLGHIAQTINRSGSNVGRQYVVQVLAFKV